MEILFVLMIALWVLKMAGQGNTKKKAATSRMQPTHSRQTVRENAQQTTIQHEELKKKLKAELERQRTAQKQSGAQTKSTSRSISADHEPLAEGESHAFSTSKGSVYMGSLHEVSTEGEDLCSPELAHDRARKNEPSDPDSVYAGEIGREPMLDFSRRGMLQGIVMSEILTRPANRARGVR